MTPEQFLQHIQKQQPSPVYLFLGSEPYRLRACREALLQRFFLPEEREAGLARFDLAEIPLEVVLDDARSFSLFSSRRLIWVANAEVAVPRARAGGEAEGDSRFTAVSLSGYAKNPTPGVVLALEASRWNLEGEDKEKAERVAKFYSSFATVVELAPFTIQAARRLAYDLARQVKLDISRQDLDLLVETVGANALQIATEIEKLKLYAGVEGKIRAEDMAAIVPDSSGSTVFALVDALACGDRERALALLSVLTRQGDYLPLALSFLASLFRYALAAKELNLRSVYEIQRQLSEPGRPIWRAKAEQIQRTAAAFSKTQIETILQKIHLADRALRDARPDDRIVMEDFVFRMTK
jgi:DNA polymerase-3 subunit delta